MKIWYLPLEPLEMRYTKMQDEETQKHFKEHNFDYETIYGEPLSSEIKTGAFLDANSTNHYKFTQLMKVTKLFNEGQIKRGDMFYISDLWFPGIEAIRYMAYFNKVEPIGISGILHAGSFTDTDYVNDMKYWARDQELSWIKQSDIIFLGSEQTRQDLISKFNLSITELQKLKVTGLAFDSKRLSKYQKTWSEKKNQIIFPHRLDDEKQPFLMETIEKLYPDIKVIYTHKHKYSKDEYYKILGESKVLFSGSLQENYGYSVLEAITLGVNPVLPFNRTSNYKYIYPNKVLYKSFEEAVEKVKEFLDKPINLRYIGQYYDNSLNRQMKCLKDWERNY